MMKPSRCSTISTPGRWRTTSRDSRRITSTRRGSLSTSPPSVRRAREGSHRARDRHSVLRPWRRSSAPPPARRRPRARARLASHAAISAAARSSPGRSFGTFGTGVSVIGMIAAVRRSSRPRRPLGEMRQHVLGELEHEVLGVLALRRERPDHDFLHAGGGERLEPGDDLRRGADQREAVDDAARNEPPQLVHDRRLTIRAARRARRCGTRR